MFTLHVTAHTINEAGNKQDKYTQIYTKQIYEYMMAA